MKKKMYRKIDVPFEIKMDSIVETEIETKGGVKIKVAKFTGFASTYGNEDLGGDVVVRGAFSKSIAETGGETIVLFNHESGRPIGKGFLEDTDEGLVMHAEINMEIQEGKDKMSLVRQGVLKGLSIGFNTLKAGFNDLGQRLLKELRLREVSLVAFPMNEMAQVFAFKGEGISQFKALNEEIEEKCFNLFKDLIAAKEMGSTFKVDPKLSQLLIKSLTGDGTKNHSDEPGEDDSNHSDEPEFSEDQLEDTLSMIEDLQKSIELIGA